MARSGDPGTGSKPASTGPEIRELVRAAREGSGGARELSQLSPFVALEQRDYEQDIALKKTYAVALLAGLGCQLVIADTVFVLYVWWGVDWEVAASVMNVWLGATLLEVVGVILVVTRYLFPRRDRQR